MATEQRLIDANALLKTGSGIKIAIRNDCHPYEAIRIQGNAFRKAVEQAPTIEARPVVHGRWKNVKETEVYSPDHGCTFTHTAQTCSACNVRIGFIGAKFYLYDDYCPNCGAKMDGGADNGQ